MIAKIVKGKGFRGLLNYLHFDEQNQVRGKVLASNLSGSSPRQWAAQFGLVRKLRPTLGRAVFHASISPAHEDRELSDDEYSALAQAFLDGMGFPPETPFIVIKHEDPEHPHIHIAASRITPNGEVVSDAKDFRKAEVLMRNFEKKLHLRCVVQGNQEQKEQVEEGSMDDQENNTLAAPEQPEVLSVGEYWNEEKKKEAKRLLLEEEYIEQLRILFRDEELAYIRRNRRKGQLQIRFKDGSSIYDEGDKLRLNDRNPYRAARRLVGLAAEKGWTSISVSGSDVFVREAMRLAIQNGMRVIPQNSYQAAMLDEVMKEVSDGGSGNRPTPVQQPKPVAGLDLGKLASFRNSKKPQGPKLRRK